MSRAWSGGLLWGCTILFYMYQYLLRAEPAAMHHAWVEEFHINATEFASVGVYYLYAYAAMQIPIGWLLDRVGIKRILLVSILVCLVGALLLAFAKVFWMVQLSRIFMGIGSATPFICSMKIIQDTFSARKQPFFCGATLTIGILGAMCAGLPLLLIVEKWGWKISAQALAMIGVVIFAAIALVIRKSPSPTAIQVERESSWKLCFQGSILRYILITIGLYAPLAILVDMWGIPFLTLKYGIVREQAASITMLGYFGLAVGSVVIPLITRSQKSLHRMILGSLIGVGLCLGMIILSFLPLTMLAIVFLVLGFLCGSLMLCYPAIGLYTTPKNSGFLFGFANGFLMLGEGALNFGVGALLDFHGKGIVSGDGTAIYTVLHYQNVLSWIFFPLLTVCIGLAWISMRSLRKKILSQ